MTLKNLAVQGMTLEIVEASNPTVQGTIVFSEIYSENYLCDGKGIYKDGLLISVNSITAPGAGATIPEPQKIETLNASSSINFNNGTKILRVDDETIQITATPKIPNPPSSPTDYTVTFKISITDAGQNKVQGE